MHKHPLFYKGISWIIVIVALSTPFVCTRPKAAKFKNELIGNGILVQGTIVGFKKYYKLADALRYEFYIDGKKILTNGNSNGKSSDYSKLSKHVIGQTFPVLASPANPDKYSKILVVPEDFEEYGLSFPDSLKWVLKYIDR